MKHEITLEQLFRLTVIAVNFVSQLELLCVSVCVSLQACLCFNVTLQCISLILYVELRSDNFH